MTGSTPSRFTCLRGRADEIPPVLMERGDTLLHAEGGTFFHVDAQGQLDMSLPTITAVHIADPSVVRRCRWRCYRAPLPMTGRERATAARVSTTAMRG